MIINPTNILKLGHFKIVLLMVSLFLTGCSTAWLTGPMRGNTEEEQLTNKIEELHANHRILLATVILNDLMQKYPHSIHIRKLLLLIGDTQFKHKHYEASEQTYNKFIEKFPNDPENEDVKKRLEFIDQDLRSFHPHFDITLLTGPKFYSTPHQIRGEDFQWNNYLFLSYFFKNSHGIYYARQSHNNDNNGIRVRSFGYHYRTKLHRRFNLTYSVGVGESKIYSLQSGSTELPHSTNSFEQSIMFDYCMTSDDRNPCWNSTMFTVGIFHTYIPKFSSAHLLGLGIGLKF